MIPKQENLVAEAKKRADWVVELLTKDSSIPVNSLAALAIDITKLLMEGNKVAFLGNGGSAAEAIHLAAEFTGKCVVDHDPLDVICLNESQSALTAIANDYGVSQMFSRMIQAHLKRGDLLICLSTSGRSDNVIRAIDQAKHQGVRTILWTGRNKPNMDGIEVWNVDSVSTPRVQELHLILGPHLGRDC